ncbi:MAG: acetyl-CoA carboxylase biotin carboxyl carrier protein subunit [Alphaproteobacteria bacterium]|nr:acetyl-CoA carboxylase biotin carboxyl carrier protein subunit [Alphaproteobacteria bacterium]
MAKSQIDSAAVRELAALLEETGLTEIEYATGEWRVRVARAANGVVHAMPAILPTASASGAPAAAPVSDAAHPGAVVSPMVGTVYMSREPGAPAFVKPGDTVKEGDTLLLIEAMKTYNEVRAPKGGRIARILVSDGDPVEFGAPLLVLE